MRGVKMVLVGLVMSFLIQTETAALPVDGVCNKTMAVVKRSHDLPVKPTFWHLLSTPDEVYASISIQPHVLLKNVPATYLYRDPVSRQMTRSNEAFMGILNRFSEKNVTRHDLRDALVISEAMQSAHITRFYGIENRKTYESDLARYPRISRVRVGTAVGIQSMSIVSPMRSNGSFTKFDQNYYADLIEQEQKAGFGIILDRTFLSGAEYNQFIKNQNVDFVVKLQDIDWPNRD
jgi:hypothetical protein